MADMKIISKQTSESGQSLVEYSLIVALVIVAFGLALASTGPAIGNVFCNTVVSLVNSNGGEIDVTYVDGDCVGIGIGTDGIAELPSAEEFWLTVTSVFENPPAERALPTRTLAPPTLTYTPGPSPTSTPITPTRTPSPTNTPTSTPTPSDFAFTAPWSDSADDVVYWRLDDTSSIGTEDWLGSYYANRTLSGTASDQIYNGAIDPSYRGKINFDWGSNGPLAGFQSDDFSVSFRRLVSFSNKTTLNFDIPVLNNGVRIWILGGPFGGNDNVLAGGPGSCSSTGVTSGGSGGHVNSVGAGWGIYGDAHFSYNPASSPDSAIPSDCLIVDRWKHGDEVSMMNITRTVPPGRYVLQVDYYEQDGDARVTVNVGTTTGNTVNPDDTRVNNTGTALSGVPNCGWYNRNTTISNSLDYMWDEYRDGMNLPAGNRCYLELRGSVFIPNSMANPALSFWDVWDLQNGTLTWVEVAEYDPNNDGIFTRNELSWQRYELHQNNTYNYSWTYQVIDLSAYRGKKVALRFGIENRASNSTNRWYIDTIRIDDVVRKDFYTAQLWTMDDPNQLSDFIMSGHWELTTENRLGADGMALHESPGRNYYNNPERRTTNYDNTDLRMHTVEFNGFINISNPLGIQDLDEDTGRPLLSFWHRYNVGRRTGLEVQYTTDPYSAGDGAVWLTAPDGLINPRNNNNNRSTPTLEFVEVPLDNLRDASNNLITRFRLRLAMTMRSDATLLDGWWIDDLQLEREGRPKFTPFPFSDNAEDGGLFLDTWSLGGGWDRIAGGRRPAAGTTGFAYTDSPTGDYEALSTTVLEMRNPFDMFMDTPQNARSAACTLPGGLCLPPSPAPVSPMLTFWHKRDLVAVEFHVEWKRVSESSTSWRTVWAYLDQMQTVGTGNRSSTRTQLAWERVEIDLKPVLTFLQQNNDTNTAIDDDILFRFRMRSTSSNEANRRDGIYVDDIRFGERVERHFRMWANGQQGTNHQGATILGSNGQPALGNGISYFDGVDNNPDLFTGAWHFGGDWDAITWERRRGLYAFHDSPVGQTEAPPFSGSQPITSFATTHQTFNVLEMATHIDLRGIDVADRPLMYFWSRFALGNSDRAMVQIAVRNDTANPPTFCRSSLPQCYDKLSGWSEWTTVWQNGTLISDTNSNPSSGGQVRTYTWQREQISLEPYAKQNGVRAGSVIRVRFVVDALDNPVTWDGWYIDDIEVTRYTPRVIPINLSGGSFFDGARNMRNWVPEGTWGLDPEFFRGAGGGPASLGGGIWQYGIWDLNSTCSSGDFLTCADNFLRNNSTSVTPTISGAVVEIRNEWGSLGPINPSNNQRIRDRFAGRWTLDTGVIGGSIPQGSYTFITASDDGVRMKYDTIPTPTLITGPGNEWNIINNWTYHGRTIDMGTANLVGGNRYRLTLEYFEGFSDAVLTLTVGNNNFSFTDSPKQGTGLAAPDIPAVPRSNSSLILDGVFDLRTATAPIIEYYTYHELGGRAYVEVTTDGGFTWTQAGLSGRAMPNNLWADPFWSGRYYAGMSLDFNSGTGGPNPSFLPERTRNDPDINFSFWGGGSPFSGWLRDQFSVRWTRRITVSTPTTLNFSTRGDDGVRLWLNYFPGCPTGDSPPQQIVSGSPRTNNGNRTYGDDRGGCLLIDNWTNQGPTTRTVTRTLMPGTHELQMDYYENGGGAYATLDIAIGGFDTADFGGTYMPSDPTVITTNWRRYAHDLSLYRGQPAVGLRFRLDRQNQAGLEEGGNFQSSNQNPVNWFESWWIVDISVVDAP